MVEVINAFENLDKSLEEKEVSVPPSEQSFGDMSLIM